MKKLGYNGRPEFERPRKLSEDEYLRQLGNAVNDGLVDQVDSRQKDTDRLYGRLAKAYLKGKALEEGLSQMGLAQFIPISDGADSVSAAATRIDNEVSLKGTIITFGLYQKCVKLILAKKWELRLDYLNLQIPESREIESKRTVESRSNSSSGLSSLLKSFLSDNGIAATILGMLTISPFQTVIFQGLVVEQGAKGIQLAQIPAGIALFLELGMKAKSIKDMLSGANLSSPVVEDAIDELDGNPEARAKALGEYGIDYDEFKKSQEVIDAETIVKYVSEYYERLGGLVEPNGFLTIDHWIAYLHTAQNQQTIKSAMNGASTFSPKFRSFAEDIDTSEVKGSGTITNTQNNEYSNIGNQLASSLQSLSTTSNQAYDDMYQAFTYNLTDRDVCCLVQIFGGANIDTEIIQTLAALIRIVCTNFSGGINALASFLLNNLNNLAADSLFDIVGQLNELYFKAIDKLTKAFTINIDNAPACTALFSLGWTLIEAVQVIFNQIDLFVTELLASFGFYESSDANASWSLAADRRHLLSIARILEAIAGQLEFLNSCTNSPRVNSADVPRDIIDPSEAVFDIIGVVPPTLDIPQEKVQKYFPGLEPRQSKVLKFNYGTQTQQNLENGNLTPDNRGTSGCNDDLSPEALAAMSENLQAAIKDLFNASS